MMTKRAEELIENAATVALPAPEWRDRLTEWRKEIYDSKPTRTPNVPDLSSGE
jgi:hypothetical protein